MRLPSARRCLESALKKARPRRPPGEKSRADRHILADPTHVVGCPANGAETEYIVSSNAPEEVIVIPREAAKLATGSGSRMSDA